MKLFFAVVTLASLLAGLDLGIPPSDPACFAAEKGGKPGKVIDFEGDVIEGMNKQPLDSVNEVAEGRNRRSKPHLYRKRKGFRNENRETVRELGYVR